MASRIAVRYAKSLVDLAKEQGKLEVIKNDIDTLKDIFKESRDFYLMMMSPIIKEDKKKNIFSAVLKGRVDDMTLAFINIVISKKRESFLPEITDAFYDQYNQLNNITPVKLTTAVPLTDDLEEKIVRLMKEKYGKDKIELTTVVDDEIIGGFILEFENKLYDASIAHQFESLKQELFKNPYIKNI